MTSCLDNLLHQRPLFTKIFLKFQDVFVATIGCIGIALIFALATKLWLIQTPFSEDCFNSFRLIWVSGMSIRKNHWLNNFFLSIPVPSTVHTGLFATWFDIHP